MEKKPSLPIDPSARARIPGTIWISYDQIMNKSLEVEVHQIMASEGQLLHVHMLRHMATAPGGYFVVKRVTDQTGEKAFWQFAQEGLIEKDYYTRLHLDPVPEGEYFLCVVSKAGYRLERIIPVQDLPNLKPVTEGENEVVYLGGRWKVAELIEAKKRLAKDLGINNIGWNPAERKHFALRRAIAVRENAAQLAAEEAQKEEQAAKKQALVEERRALRKAIERRGTVLLYTKAGMKVRGIPAEDREWQVMPHGTRIVLVKEYKEGQPVESLEVESYFMIDKKAGGMFRKDGEIVGLSLQPPSIEARPKYGFIKDGGFFIEREGEMSFVREADRPNFRAMVEDGLNSGTLVAIEVVPADKEKPRQIHEFTETGPRVIGMFDPIYV